jgi:hypothetical protein
MVAAFVVVSRRASSPLDNAGGPEAVGSSPTAPTEENAAKALVLVGARMQRALSEVRAKSANVGARARDAASPYFLALFEPVPLHVGGNVAASTTEAR